MSQLAQQSITYVKVGPRVLQYQLSRIRLVLAVCDIHLKLICL